MIRELVALLIPSCSFNGLRFVALCAGVLVLSGGREVRYLVQRSSQLSRVAFLRACFQVTGRGSPNWVVSPRRISWFHVSIEIFFFSQSVLISDGSSL